MGQTGCCTRRQVQDYTSPTLLANKTGASEVMKSSVRAEIERDAPHCSEQPIQRPGCSSLPTRRNSLAISNPTHQVDKLDVADAAQIAKAMVPSDHGCIKIRRKSAVADRGCTEDQTQAKGLSSGKVRMAVFNSPVTTQRPNFKLNKEQNCKNQSSRASIFESPKRDTIDRQQPDQERRSVFASTGFASRCWRPHRGKQLNSFAVELLPLFPEKPGKQSERLEKGIPVLLPEEGPGAHAQASPNLLSPDFSTGKPSRSKKVNLSPGNSNQDSPVLRQTNDLLAGPLISSQILFDSPQSCHMPLFGSFDRSNAISAFLDCPSSSLDREAIESFLDKDYPNPARNQALDKYCGFKVRKAETVHRPLKGFSPTQPKEQRLHPPPPDDQKASPRDKQAFIFKAQNCPFFGRRKSSIRPIMTAKRVFKISSVDLI